MTDLESTFRGGVMAVTGGASGIGEGLARYGASLGMKVAIGDINMHLAEVVVADLRASGADVFAIETDVRDEQSVDTFAAQAYAEFGPVTLAINNAGIEQFGYVWETPIEIWQRVIDINVTGAFNGAKAFIPRMAEAGVPARLWNTSSLGGVATAPRQASYVVSKHAVLALTETLKLEIDLAGYDIAVGAIMPGSVKTRIFDDAPAGPNGTDSESAAAERAAMKSLQHTAVTPLDAAREIFGAAAAGHFYLHTDSEMGALMMDLRAERLRGQLTPELVPLITD